MDFFTSDQHFGHSNSIRYCNRPFKNVYDMDNTIINNWNKRVKPNDTVYVNGDFIFRGNDKYVEQIVTSLNGKIVLILGDHDKTIKKFMKKESNISIFSKKVEMFDYLWYDKNDIKIALFHWCIRTWQRSHYNSFHLYGHSHGRLPPLGKSWDVGVDNNKFEPLSLDEVIDIMKTRPNNMNLIKKGTNE
jgi:calcineurin-like phosphoesterase family protein